jgi:hypothetical protein
LLKIHEDIGRPKRLAKLVARDYFPGTGQQKRQSAERQVLKTDPYAIPPEFPRAEVGFERTEANGSRRHLWRTHT